MTTSADIIFTVDVWTALNMSTLLATSLYGKRFLEPVVLSNALYNKHYCAGTMQFTKTESFMNGKSQLCHRVTFGTWQHFPFCFNVWRQPSFPPQRQIQYREEAEAFIWALNPHKQSQNSMWTVLQFWRNNWRSRQTVSDNNTSVWTVTEVNVYRVFLLGSGSLPPIEMSN